MRWRADSRWLPVRACSGYELAVQAHALSVSSSDGHPWTQVSLRLTLARRAQAPPRFAWLGGVRLLAFGQRPVNLVLPWVAGHSAICVMDRDDAIRTAFSRFYDVSRMADDRTEQPREQPGPRSLE
jgi:hypothetical protein